MYKRIRNELVCPVCRAELKWDIEKQDVEKIYEGTAACVDCGRMYPVHKGVASFLQPKYNDLRIWKKCDRSNYKKPDHETKNSLMGKRDEELSQEEILIKIAMIEEGEVRSETEISDLYELYFQKQGMGKSLDYIYELMEQLCKDLEVKKDDILLDFASGRGLLAHELAREAEAYLVISDINPLILEKCSDFVETAALSVKGAKVSYLVFDMKRNPFRSNSVAVTTTLFGIQNILHTQNLLAL